MTQTMLNAVVKDTIITAAKVSAPILITVSIRFINKYISSYNTNTRTNINICT